MTDQLSGKMHGYYGAMFDLIRDGLMLVGADGTILMANQAMENMTGRSKDELIGSSCTILNCDACELTRTESQPAWCLLFQAGIVKEKRCLLMRADGSYVCAVKSALIVREGENGGTEKAFEIFVDISQVEDKEREIRKLVSRLNIYTPFYGLVGESPAMKKLLQFIEVAAQRDDPVIIYGEKGTGKELIAHTIHLIGRRRKGPFIDFKSGGVNEVFVEGELFGYTRDTFEWAHRHRRGALEAAHGGEIFFSEIGEMPLSVQSKLIKVFESKQFQRVGEEKSLSVDTRVIASSKHDLLKLVSEGKFRQDLFFKLNAAPIYVPPLRERREDILPLTIHFLTQLNMKTSKRIEGVSPAVLKFFKKYDWPSNIEELKQVLNHAFTVAEGRLIDTEHLPSELYAGTVYKTGDQGVRRLNEGKLSLSDREALVEALRVSKGNKSRAAEVLGIHRMTLWNRMKKYGIELRKEID